MGWLYKSGEEYDEWRKKYKLARAAQAETMFEDMLEIADESATFGGKDHAKVNAAKLRVDTRKWALAKMKPDRYGDKVYETAGNATQVNVMVNAPKSESIEEWVRAQKMDGRTVTVDADGSSD
jgi:cytochrome c5